MAEIASPQTDEIIAQYGDRVDFSPAQVATMRAEETAASVEGLWLDELPPVFQTDAHARAIWYNPDDLVARAQTKAWLQRGTLLGAGDKNKREHGIILGERMLREALKIERESGQRELISHIDGRLGDGNISLSILYDNVEIPGADPTLRGMSLFWPETADPDGNWMPYAVSIEDQHGLTYSAEAGVVMHSREVWRAAARLALLPREALGYLYDLDRAIHGTPAPAKPVSLPGSSPPPKIAEGPAIL